MEYLIVGITVLVAIVVVNQILIRRHYVFACDLEPSVALRTAAVAIGGGKSFLDASGALSIPLGRNRILSVVAEPLNAGSLVEVWLSSYDFINANGFQVIAYQKKVRRIRRSCGIASQSASSR
ncbi:MAG: hypothetical protein QM695_14455 [Micropruina sp.]